MKRSSFALGGAALALLVATPADATAQEEFVFAGVWVGEFEDQAEPERDMATRGGRERRIAQTDRYECEGEWRLSFRGGNDDLAGNGEIEPICKASRRGEFRLPVQLMQLENFDFDDKGEGKDKELKFRFRMPSMVFETNELIRCEAKGKYKPKDMVFEGDYNCRQELRMSDLDMANDDNRGTTAMRIRGKFKLTRGGVTESGA